MTTFTEAVVEQASLGWLAGLAGRWRTGRMRPELSRQAASERTS